MSSFPTTRRRPWTERRIPTTVRSGPARGKPSGSPTAMKSGYTCGWRHRSAIRLEKTIRLRRDISRIAFRHTLSNPGFAPFHFLWKLHPALAVTSYCVRIKRFPNLTGFPHVTWLACSAVDLCHASILEMYGVWRMARRKGGLTELLDIASALPWKVSAALIPISFAFFHVIAGASDHSAAPTDVAGLGPVVIRAYIHTFACFFSTSFPSRF